MSGVGFSLAIYFKNYLFFSPISFRSPLEGSLNMKLSAHTESNSTAKGFLTYFTEVNGYGDWHRRWCVLKDLTLYFWKYPEDEQKRKAPIEVSSKFWSCLGTISLLRQQKWPFSDPIYPVFLLIYIYLYIYWKRKTNQKFWEIFLLVHEKFHIL